VVKNRLIALGAKKPDAVVDSETEADAASFAEDLVRWTNDLKAADVADAAEPTFVRARDRDGDGVAPIRCIPTTTVNPTGADEAAKKRAKDDAEKSDDGEGRTRSIFTLVPIRPRPRGERRFLRTLPVASLRPPLAFNTRPRRLSTPLLTPFNSTPTLARVGRPVPEELSEAESMLFGASGLTPDDSEDMSVANTAVDVKRTLRAMEGATARERRWVATREKEKGNELFKAREYRSAIEAYGLSLALDPSSAATRCNRAAAYMKLKRWHDAIADCDAAIKSDGAYFKAYARRAAAALETGADDDARRALDDLAAADAIEPGSKEIEKLRQRALRAVNDADRGKMRRMTIAEVEDDDDDADDEETTTKKRSSSAADAGGDDASFIPSETFAGAKPGYYFRDDARGAGYYRDENGNRAETEPKTTTKTKTKTKTKAASAEKPTTNAFSFDKKKKTPTPATTATTPAEAAKARGNEHFKRKEFARAKAAYDEAIASDPGMATAFCNRAGARHHLRDYQGAEEDATRAIEIETAYSKAYHRRAAARRALGKNADALSDYDSAIETASAGGGGSNVADLKEEKASLIDDMKFEKLKPARQGPMVFEEIEDEAPEPVVEEEDLTPPPPEPWPTSTLTDDDDDDAAAAETTASSETETGRRRLAIEEDDSSDDEDDAPSASAAPAAPPKTPDSSSRRKIPIVEDEDDDDDDEATTTTTTTETRGKNGDGDGDGADADAAAKMKRTADDAFKRGDMRAACDLYTACLASASASSSSGGSSVAAVKVAALANRAAARLKLEDYAGAEKDASDVLEMDGAHVKAHHRRAAARVKLGRVHDALVDYAVVRKAFPRHKGVLAEIEEAEALAAAAPAPTPTPKPKPKPAAAAEPPSASAAEIAELKQKGNAAFVRGSHREAIEHYAAAVHLATRANDDKTAAILLANRAASRLKLGEYAAAREDASEAIARDPKYVKAYHRRAAARSGLKDFENALEDYEVVVRANPGSETLRNEVNACMQRAAEAMLGGMDLGSLSGGGGDRAASSASAKKAVVVEADSDDRRVLYTGPHTTPSAW